MAIVAAIAMAVAVIGIATVTTISIVRIAAAVSVVTAVAVRVRAEIKVGPAVAVIGVAGIIRIIRGRIRGIVRIAVSGIAVGRVGGRSRGQRSLNGGRSLSRGSSGRRWRYRGLMLDEGLQYLG